jgi:nucleotide-binding universal stress UspA family protein
MDLLAVVPSYPDAPPASALGNAVALAGRLGGEITALVLRIKIRAPHNRLANALVHLDAMIEEEEARSLAQGRRAAEAFLAKAAEQGLRAAALTLEVPLYGEGDAVCVQARTRDLTLLSIGPRLQGDQAMAETVLFGAGRPVLVFPETPAVSPGGSFDTVAIAWDGGRTAARAVADALPVLTRAGQVRVLTVVDEKPEAGAGAARDLVRHLATHGVTAVVDEVTSGGEPIGKVLNDYVSARTVDLLVMGGFGHSRAREFVLGGATRAMLEAPPCPILMSH